MNTEIKITPVIHETTGTRRLSLWSYDSETSGAYGDNARGTAYSAVYLSDDEHGCAEINIYPVECDDGTWGVEEQSICGPAVNEDGIWRPDDSSDIDYDWASALVYHSLEDAQRFADDYGPRDLSWCLHLRKQEGKS